MTRRRAAVPIRLALTAGLVLAACAPAEPQPPVPEPVVTTVEFENRLAEHLARFTAEVLEPDAQVAAAAHSRATGCPGGPDWGVVPRAETAVTAGDQAEKFLEDLQSWMGGNGFADTFEDEDRRWEPDGTRAFSGVGGDGTAVRAQIARDSPRFTITLTGPCTWPPDRPGGPPETGVLAPLPPPSGPASLGGSADLDPRVCRSPKLYVLNDDAPAYAGPGPHPMALVTYTGRTNYQEEEFAHDEILLPRSMAAQFTSESRPAKSAHLVVCVHIEITGDTGRDVTCRYTYEPAGSGSGVPIAFDLHDSVYRVTVREARTGAKVAEFTLPGTRGGDGACPFRLDVRGSRLALALDESELERRLRPVFDGRP
ncbi:hypothetical protein [Amycolatopsis thermoflava]|uniref:hypothetical protein n=1 Tax=Amycolatopsis thermoflava TaxID=84480 RepID=UPI0012F7B17A|nr:hypothetical protein [Amycolatopsis thermoflava]